FLGFVPLSGFWVCLGFFLRFLLPLFLFPCPIPEFFDPPKSQISTQVSQNLPGKEGSTEVPLLRVGWSVDFSHSQLGEDEFSYGFDGRGLKVENGKFEEFGESFGENDVIGCFADFEGAELVELSFSKNGQELGAAFRVPKDTLGILALIPLVLMGMPAVVPWKCCALFPWETGNSAVCPSGFTGNPSPAPLGILMWVPWEFGCPMLGFPPLPSQVLLMVGLPGSGKTQWAQKHSQENRDKRYNILGTERVLHQLRTRGPEPEELDAKSRELLTQQAAQCLSKLVQIAPRARRNFILDQCNVYNSGQRRKLSAFKGFSRKVVVIVPSEPDWQQRLELRRQAEGDDVPESVMLEMKANYSLPEKSEYVDEVLFGELGRDEAAAGAALEGGGAEAAAALGGKNGGKWVKTGENGIKCGKMGSGNRQNKWNQRNHNRGQGYGFCPQGYRNFYERYRGYDDRFYGRDYDYNRYRDYYRQYNREGDYNGYRDYYQQYNREVRPETGLHRA
ncbi:PREDICTED: LOW QUALITY PROTEIN: heterogeneous nuclear ribonucleoprotein U-like protein 2, partial [Ficedula albicollis]|uniref:LOW QUALITY PROTEIN: heterogeneous nuclear ribonucleoprotein U-like protein 2 n=1 Tax=Ficedula albicollis TaxID=59894 RepID=UPI0007AD9624